ncbi:MAG: alpha-L-rhamnosidase C-terminal domain-containing protein [Sedimentisphaerales bacterium]
MTKDRRTTKYDILNTRYEIGLLFFAGILFILPAVAQASDVNINPDLLTKRWQASWVSHPTASSKDYGVYHFRRTFDLDSQPEKFIIHVSADNRYRLFVNGQSVCRGPARGDLMHWRYETVDIAPYLVKGKNAIAAVVWNFGEFIPGAQMTLRTAFVLQADDPRNNFVNTDQKWKAIQDIAYSPVSPSLNSFNFVGPGEKIVADKYPWGWQQTDFNDSAWPKVRSLDKAVPPGVATNNTWMLVSRTIPLMEDKLQRIDKVRRTAGVEINDNFFDGQHKLIVPANTRATILFDQTFLTTAYPELSVSGGKDSQIVLTFSEALFDSKMQKGNRDEIEGRKITGFTDTFLPDGGDNRLFSTLWFRTWRYLQMDIQTKDAPLTINDFYGRFTAYPFKENASFSSSDPSIKNIWDVGWRTARLCANETYFDCPYYEQLQYVGDTRIQALISLYVSGDDRLMRNAIAAFDDSRVPEGLTQSRYPCSSMQIIPPYSLFWVAMVHDYWMHRDDSQFVKSYLPGIDSVLNWHEKYIGSNGMLGATPWWNFVDWSWPWDSKKDIGGVPPSDNHGCSSILTLQFVYALNYAAQLNDNLGKKYFADHYRKLSDSLKKSTYKLCWDNKRGLLADTPDKTIFSQHANILAVLVDLVPPNEQKKLMEKVVSEKNPTQCTFYFRYYLVRAIKKVGLGDRYVEMLQPWRDMLKMGLTTFAENPEPTRSDCHAWSASPNYDLLATVCGIEPAEPGFKSVRIEPHLGPLTWVEGKMPHPLGEITVRLERNGKTGIKGSITLPPGLTGKFFWNGKSTNLKPGSQMITM